MISITPLLLEPVFILQEFTDIIQASTDDVIMDGMITSVEISASYENDGVSLIENVNNCIITGAYTVGVFPNQTFEHITYNGSTKTETSLITNSFPVELYGERIPITYTADSTQTMTISFSIDVKTTIKTQRFTLTKIIRNSWTHGRDYLNSIFN
jgi:hypothetical protein